MAHAPNVTHTLIKNGALHSCDQNKLSLQYSLFLCAFHMLSFSHESDFS